jgi:hypothetical protein
LSKGITMTRSQWLQLPERERNAIRQASAEASLRHFTPPRSRRRSDWERAMEVWKARDAYREEHAILGGIVLLLLGCMCMIAGIFLR